MKMKLKTNCSIVRMFGMFECGRLVRSIIAAYHMAVGHRVAAAMVCALCVLGLAMATEAQEVKPVLRAENVRVEQRFPWTNLVDVCFTITNTLESAKNTNVIARVRAFYDESKALGVTNLHFAKADGSPDLSKQFVGGDVPLEVDGSGAFQQIDLKPNEVRLVWDAKKDVPPEAEWTKTLRFTVALGLTAKEAEDADAAASRTAWLDVRTNKVYQFEDTIPVSHSAGNWANQPASPTAKARVMWEAAGGSKSDAGSYTDDVPLTMTLNELGQYDIIHVAKNGTLSSNAFTVVKRQLGTEFEPWIVSEEGKDEVRAIMRSETELCIEGDGTTMADFGGCGPWGEKVESVYFANTNQQISVGAFAGCANLRVVMTKGNTDALKDQLKKSGFSSKVVGINLDDLKTKVKMFDIAEVNGRAKVFCVVYDDEAASKEYGSNFKLKLKADIKGTEKTVKHLHRLENGIEYDDMMLWQKKDGRPQFVTLIWDALLDVTAAEFSDPYLGLSVTATPCDDTSVKVANGNFVGVLDGETGIRTWKGIPYAKQPTGEDRWKAMGDPYASSETFAAKQFGHAAIQMYDKTETGGCIEQGDDCLVLNVWSTDEKEDVGCDWGKRPVMVYIHGGAFVLGGSADIHYDGRNIVERNKDVVVVTINYRVGLMGFIDLKNVPSGENFADSPNLAILDQRQALIWVQKNIAAFGGDKDNVTIFGESAGGASVAVHMTSKNSAPYFKRAIQMSGALDLTMTEKAYEERQLTERLVAEVAKLRFDDVSKTNYVDMTVLQSLTVDEIRKIMATPYADMENPGYELSPDDLSGGLPLIGAIMNYPMCDKRGAIPADPFKAFAENGVANGKDYMVGSTHDEWRYFMGYDGADDPLRNYYTGLISDRMRQDRVWFGADHQWRLTNFLATVKCELDEMDTRYPDIWKKTQLENLLAFRLPAIRMAEIHAGLAPDPESGVKGKTYMYRFDKARVYADQPWAGAGHACENDYAFHNTSGVDYGPIDESLADKVNDAFVNFARTGNPNGGSQVGEAKWEEYDATDRKTMLFQNDCTTALAEDPDGDAREMFLESGAYDTYTKARSDAKRRTTTDTPFVRVELPAGTADDYWQIGKTAADNVIAFTNATGRLFVEGKGDIRDFYALGGGLWFNEATTEVEFGPGVTGIGSNMLSKCSGITNIVVFAAVPPTLAGETLPPTTQAFIIEVPKASVDEYKGADGWNDYAGRIQAYVWLGDKEKPWKIGATADDTVVAWTNGTDKLVIEGAGAMKGFKLGGPEAGRILPPWMGMDISEVEIGEDVTLIGAYAFSGCALTDVTLKATRPPTLSNTAFGGAPEAINVPLWSKGAYTHTAVWSDYADEIVEPEQPQIWAEGYRIKADKQVGVCSWTWHGSISNALEQTAADGRYNGMQLALAPWLGIDNTGTYFGDQEGPEVWEFIKERVADGSLNVMSTMINFPKEDYETLTTITNTMGYMYGVADSASDAEEQWKTNLYFTAEAARLSKELGVDTLSTEAGFIIVNETLMFERMKEVCMTCAVHGVQLLIESGPQNSLQLTNLLVNLEKEGFTNVGINFDPGDTELFGSENPVDSFKIMKPWIRMVHVKDCKENDRTQKGWNEDCVWGDGVVSQMDFNDNKADPRHFLEQLTAEGYAGDILYERLSGDETLTPARKEEITLAMDRIFAALPQPIAAESDEFTVDLRPRVEFEKGKTRIDVVTWSETAWGTVPGSKFADLGFTNKTTGATGVIAEGLVGENLDDCPLPEKDGEYLLTHSTGDLKSFVTFVVSGYPLGTPTNPWLVGPDGSRDSTVAWKDGKDAIVYFKPPRSAVSRAGLETLTNAMGGVIFDMMLVTADDTVTNEVKMIIGASGKQYTKLEDMLESDDDSWTFYDVTGCVVTYDGMGHSGTMASDTFLPGVPTNLTANAYTAFGYEFQGWTTNGDTKVVFKDKAKIDDPQPGDIYDLKAVWKLTPVTVGKGVTAYLDENGVLHIKGKGKMKDFTATDPAPWAEFAPDIKAIEVAEGVTKIGNAAFEALDYETTTTELTFQDEDHVLNLLAFVSADGSETNAPSATAFSVHVDSTGTVEPVEAFMTQDGMYVSPKAAALMSVGYDEVRLLTLPDLKAVQTAELIGAAGETPHSKTMQGLLDEALDKIDKATNYDEVVDGYVERWNQIVAQAAKDKTNEIEGSKITWRVLDGTLYISGEGKMPDFVAPAFTNGAPWNVMKADITNATVAAGITSVGNAAFAISPAFEESSVLFKDPEQVINLGAFADGSQTNVPTVKVEIETEDGRTLRVVPGGWTDADNPNVTYDSLAEAIEDGATTVVAAFAKATDEGEKAVPPAEVEEVVKTVSDPDDPEKKIELTATYENVPTAEGSAAGLVSEVENLRFIVDNTGSNITVVVTATNKMDVAEKVVEEMDGAMSNDCESVKADLGFESVGTVGFDSSYLDMSAFSQLGNYPREAVVEFTQSVIAHIPMKLYDGQIYSVSRRHKYGTKWVTEVLPMWEEGIDADEKTAATNEWVKADVANQELVVKTRRFCDYALGTLELEKTCTIIVGDGSKALGDEDPKALATNFQIRVTGALNTSDFAGYAKRAKGESAGDYAINFVCTKMPKDYDGPFVVEPGTFTIEPAEMIAANGTVTYPKAQSNGYLQQKKAAAWKAKAKAGCVFAGWVAADGAPACVTTNLEKFSWNELRDPKLSFTVAKGERIAPKDIAATWAHIDEDQIAGIAVVTNSVGAPTKLVVDTLSHVTASAKGLPAGLKLSSKTLKFSGKPTKNGTFKVTVSVKNASGYTAKQTFRIKVSGKKVTSVVPADDFMMKGVSVMIWCDAAMGSTTGTGVYALPKKLKIKATPKKGYEFAGWYWDPGFSEPVTTFAKDKDYRGKEQSLVLTGPTYLFARFVEKTTKADPIVWLRYAGAGYCGADASVFAEDETWYQGVKLPTNACQIAFGSLTWSTVKVTGLPKGVTFDAKTLSFKGVPTKTGKFTVKVSVSNRCGSTDVLKVPVTVVALPKWTVGNFDGYHIEDGATNGTFTATVGSTGKVSGKTAGGLAATTFSAKSFSDVFTLDGSNLIYTVDVTVKYKVGKKTYKQTDTLYLMADSLTGLGTIGGGDRDGCGSVGVQRAWDRKDLAYLYREFDTKALKNPLKLENGLTLKFGAKGKVTVGGKVDGVKASGTTYVMPVLWTDEGMTNLVAQVPVYVAKAGFCAVYDVQLTVGEGGKFNAVSLSPSYDAIHAPIFIPQNVEE